MTLLCCGTKGQKFFRGVSTWCDKPRALQPLQSRGNPIIFIRRTMALNTNSVQLSFCQCSYYTKKHVNNTGLSRNLAWTWFYKQKRKKPWIFVFYEYLTFPNCSGGCFVSVLLADTFSITHTPSPMMQITFPSYLQSAWIIASDEVLLLVWLNSFAAQESN